MPEQKLERAAELRALLAEPEDTEIKLQ